MIDLHTHSTFSDGTDTPAQLLKKAEQAGLSAIALTDHNSVEGLPEFLEAGRHSPVRCVPGSEFSTEYHGTELHIVALFLPEKSYDEVRSITGEFHRRKVQSNLDLVERLRDAGYDICYEEVRQKSGGYVNRAHIASVLLEKGIVTDRNTAFSTILSDKGPYYVPPRRPDVFRVIGAVRDMGAVPILAHPFLNLSEGALLAFLPRAKEAGLMGMEVLYEKFDEATRLRAGQIAETFGLLPSGGTDYHGGNKPGLFLGSVDVPDRLLRDLEESIR